MGQFTAHDQGASRYALEVEQLVSGWDRGASACVVLLEDNELRAEISSSDLTDHLRRAQYRAHLGAEVGNGLAAPSPLGDAHAALVDAFVTCRETLAVLAVRAELDELDDEAATYGIRAIRLVDEAFDGVRATAELAYAWHADVQHTAASDARERRQSASVFSIMTWVLVGTCTAIVIAVIVELVLTHA